MGRRPNNYKETAPPPSVEDLTFQNSSWYHRYGNRSTAQLAPSTFNSFFSDKSLTWEIGGALSGAAKILLQEDSD